MWTDLEVSRRLSLPECLDNTHVNVVSLSALPTGLIYPQEIFLVLISVRSRVDFRAIVRPECLSQWRIVITPSGIGPATFRLLAQCLNTIRTKWKVQRRFWIIKHTTAVSEVREQWAHKCFHIFCHSLLALYTAAFFVCLYTGCFTTCGYYCRRWFPRSLWSKKFI